MALTRKMLAAMDIPAEKIDEIINAHTETVNAIKEERDSFKADSEELGKAKKELEKTSADLEKANADLEKIKSEGWEEKYKSVKDEYDGFKKDAETKAEKQAKENAYKKLLVDTGISEKRVASILKVTDIDAVELDGEGKLKDAEKLAESVKDEWADFISTTEARGADTPNPPANGGGNDPKEPSRAAQLVAQYRNEHYGNPKED